MKSAIILTAIVTLFLFSQFRNPEISKPEDPSLVKKWETDTLLKTPESVLFDPAKNILYVSNINGKSGEKDGNGFISRLTLDGKIDKLEWVKGLDAPKGMGLYKNLLYVADLTKIIVINTDKGEIVKTIDVEGAQFLNDITVDEKGVVYISDSSGKKVYKLEKDVPSIWMEDEKLIRPNGLLSAPGQFYIVDMGPGILYTYNTQDKKLTQVAQGVTSGDGIVLVGKNQILVSNWNGEINYVSENNEVKKLLDTKDQKINAADIEYVKKGNLVLVPTFFKNKVVAYQFKN